MSILSTHEGRSRRARRLRAAILIVVLGLASLWAVLTVLAVWVKMSTSPPKFDAAVWKAESNVAPREQRARMLGDIYTHIKTGMSRKQVVTLLGPPNWNDRDELTYLFGYELSSISISDNGGMLRFVIGNKGKVK